MLYQDYETDISKDNISSVFSKVKEPCCLLGGWAVYLTVNANFEESQGRSYIGSKDIDLGFHIDKKWSDAALNKSILAQSIKALKDAKFLPLGFRFVKYYHTETKSELSEDETKGFPLHLMFGLYVDPIVDNIHPNSKSILGFRPIDEPLLSEVFTKKKYKMIKEFGVKIMLPSPEVLLATKLNSVCDRDKAHKRIKDIADIYALIWYSSPKPAEIKNNIQKIIDMKKIAKVISSFSDEDYSTVSQVLEIDKSEIEKVIKSLLSISVKSMKPDLKDKERWGPTNVGYDSYKKIINTLHVLKADTITISMDSVASSSGFRRNSIGNTMNFLESIGVVKIDQSEVSLTPRGQTYVRAMAEEDPTKIKEETKKIIDTTYLNKLKNFIMINKSDLTLEKLYKHVQTEARFGAGTGPFGLHQPHATSVKTLLQITKDSGYLPEDFIIDIQGKHPQGVKKQKGSTSKKKPITPVKETSQQPMFDESRHILQTDYFVLTYDKNMNNDTFDNMKSMINTELFFRSKQLKKPESDK